MIHIGIDGNDANVMKKVGVSVYTWELLTRFHAQASEQLQFTIYLRARPNEDMPKTNTYWRYQVVNGPFLWSRIWLPLYLYTHDAPTVFFSPTHYTPRFNPSPLVVTIHDLAYFYFSNEFLKKDLYKLKNWTKESVDKAAAIIAVSDSTKQDVNKWYGTPLDKVIRIYNGFSQYKGTKSPDSYKKYGLKRHKYLLYVGTLQPRKNVTAIIHALKALETQFPDLQLALVGRRGWLFEGILKTIRELGLSEKVKELGYVPNEDLSGLYKNSACLVLPSFYEGFGIPVLEALSQGAPVVTSNTSSLPEVGGDACLYVDPNDTMQLATAIERLMTDEGLRKDLHTKGLAQVKKFSWDTCATETLEVLKKIAYEGQNRA